MTPEQLRMGRAALKMTTREIGAAVGLSHTAIANFERGDESTMSVATAKRLEAWFIDRRVFFGPKHGVCLDSDVFAAERWYSTALFKLLDEAGIHPSSSELIAAGRRAESSNEWQRGCNAVLRPSLSELSEAIDAAVEMIERMGKMEAALQIAMRQNSHDMLMTGDELRQCEAALEESK